MTITVLYFAVLRERARRERETVTLSPGSDVAAARAAVASLHPELAALLPRVQAAVNRAMVADAHALAEGDELAFIPPVAGGSGPPPVAGGSGPPPVAGGSGPPRIAIERAPLRLDDVVAAVVGDGGERGGVVTFAGVVRRDGHALRDVVRLEYEAYTEMALEVLAAIADELERELPGARVAIHHRVGALAVGETAVVIAAAAPHRAEAFTACRAAIDRLKERAPIWKKEVGESGEVWLGLGA